MFGLFESSKTKEIKQCFRVALWNVVAEIDPKGGPEDKSLVTLANKLVKDWIPTLPKHVVDNVSASSLAAYVLICECQVFLKNDPTTKSVDLFVKAAKLAVKGIGLRMPNLHSDELQLMITTAKIADSIGLDFYSELTTIA